MTITENTIVAVCVPSITVYYRTYSLIFPKRKYYTATDLKLLDADFCWFTNDCKPK